LILLVCFVDTTILNFVPAAEGAHGLCVRLMPALQILRLGRLVQELRLIIKGIISAMHAVMWSMGLLFLVIYSSAVICTSYISSSHRFQQDALATGYFGNLGDAMFTLFTFATLEDFPDAVRHFMKDSWSGTAVALAIIAFILFTNLALLNLVTAVMVDSIIDILPKKRTEKLAQERAAAIRRLESLFSMMDKDGNRKLTLEEFENGVANMEEVKFEMTRLQMTTFDVKELFMLIDFNDNGTVSVDEFIEGLLRVAPGPATRKELMGIQYDLHRMWNMLGAGQERLQVNVEEGMEERLRVVERSLQRSVASVQEQVLAAVEKGIGTLSKDVLDGQQTILESIEAASFTTALRRFDDLESAVSPLPATIADLKVLTDGKFQKLGAQSDLHLSRLQGLVGELREGQVEIAAAVQAASEQLSDLKIDDALVASEPQPAAPQVVESSPLDAAASDDFASGFKICEPVTREAQLPRTLLGRITSGAGSKVTAVASPAAPLPPVAPSPPATSSTAAPETPTLPVALSRGRAVAPVPSASPVAGATPVASAPFSTPVAAAPQEPVAAAPCLPQFAAPDADHSRRAARRYAWSVDSPELTSQHRATPVFPQELGFALTSSVDFSALSGSRERLLVAPAWSEREASRVDHVRWWVRQQGWASQPFDKLVLHLDRLGIELTIAEQDQLKRSLYRADGSAT